MLRSLRENRGFTLVELIVVMLIFVIVIGITGDAFNRIVTRALSITKTSESNIGGIVGLEMMRVDLESAGYGLPWSFSQDILYSEATGLQGAALNDNNRTYVSDPSQDNLPRAVMSINGVASAGPAIVFGGSDVLTVRSLSVATNAASKRWTYIESASLPNNNPTPQALNWTHDNIDDNNRIIMIQPIANLKPTKQLVVNSSDGTWNASKANYATIGTPPAYHDAEKKSDAYIIYGADDNGSAALRMPFNRADYYVRRPATVAGSWTNLPQRCNPSTGVLFKGVVSQANGSYQELPLLECVLDMQIVYELRTTGTTMTTESSDISLLTAKDVREQVKAIKVYILTHDGGADSNYTYPNATIGVGPGDGIISGTGRTYDFATNLVTNWQNYHWRVYQVVARPNNLTGNIAQ